ncbi:MAG: penicillin-binding protein 2 [Candidatus Nomurabacteria bacterium]|jgi:cell division protein FtsI/penicillin-binding protein 2|nr:penicillin-binding protein 2 [Candidatus Nomurabacteria bacterium]
MNRRIKFVAIAVALAFLAIFGRLLSMQVFHRDDYVLAAEQTQVHEWKLRASRGLIYWRDGVTSVPAVLNEQVYLVFVDYAMVEDVYATRTAIQEKLGSEAASKFDTAISAKKSRYVVLARNISRERAEELKAADLAGIGFEESTKRVYPENELGARILGFVNGEGQGQYGVEGAFNQSLVGKDGLRKATTDLRNVPLSVGRADTLVPAENGTDIRLTIDRNLQAMAEEKSQKWAATYGAEFVDIIIYNATNGEVLAMASKDSYDPANYGDYELADFANPVLTDAYEPASVMKVVTMAAALHHNALEPTDTYLNSRGLTIDGLWVQNMTDRAAGSIQTFQEAMDWSFNVGSIAMLERIGGGSLNLAARQKLYDFQMKLGFGKTTGIELPDSAGLVNSPNMAYAANHCYALMTFGQCESLTMLQYAAAFSAIISSGTRYRPTIIQGQGSQVAETNIISAETSHEMRGVLHSAINLYLLSREDSFFNTRYCGGKTGTAQVPNPAGGYYDDRQTGTFFGWCSPSEDNPPELVVGVRYGGAGVLGGGSGAKSIWDDLMRDVVSYSEGVIY